MSHVLKPHHRLIKVVGLELVLLGLGSLDIESSIMEVYVTAWCHSAETSKKSGLFGVEEIAVLEVLLQEKVWVCEVKGEGYPS